MLRHQTGPSSRRLIDMGRIYIGGGTGEIEVPTAAAAPPIPPTPPAPPSSGIIWRPDGVSGGNVRATWPEVQAVVDAASGAVLVYVDTSLAPAVVPPGTWNGYGAARMTGANGAFLVTVSDGADLAAWASFDGIVLQCECVTKNALSFGADGTLLLFNFAAIVLATGALVPAIEVTTASNEFALYMLLGNLDNSNAPTVPVVHSETGTLTTYYVQGAAPNFSALETGNEIGGAVGSTVDWENDAATPPLDSSLFFGTVSQEATAQAAYAVPLYGPSANRPVPPVALLGQMFFDTTIVPNRPIWYTGTLPTGWVDATGASA